VNTVGNERHAVDLQHGDALKTTQAPRPGEPVGARFRVRGMHLRDHKAPLEAPNLPPMSLASSDWKKQGFSQRPALQVGKVQGLFVQGRPILWSCCGLRVSANGPECRKENKSRVLWALLKSFLKIPDPFSMEPPDSFHLISDRMGKPRVMFNGSVGPSVSFSHCSGMTWAALSGPESEVGIDAARPEEFEGAYPFQRVFLRGELDRLLEKTEGDRNESAALVWSAKEAFVKAMGCGFHLFSPLDVSATLSAWEANRALFHVRLTDRGLEKFPCNSESQMEIKSFRFGGTWMSVAAMVCPLSYKRPRTVIASVAKQSQRLKAEIASSFHSSQ